MEALKALGYEVSPIEGGVYGEKRRGGVVYQVFYAEKGDLRLRRKQFLKGEARPLARAGVAGHDLADGDRRKVPGRGAS